MKRFAITGGLGCGKSTVAAIWAKAGCRVLDADEVAHALEAPGGEAAAAIGAAFGPGALRRDGGVDRARLGAKVFRDPAALQRLNGIVHPLVRRHFREWLAGVAPADVCVGVVPLLFETGWTEGWDGVACVSCAPGEQFRRLRQRGWSDDDIRRRLAAQMPPEEKERRAGWVIRNDGSIEELERVAGEVLRAMMENSA